MSQEDSFYDARYSRSDLILTGVYTEDNIQCVQRTQNAGGLLVAAGYAVQLVVAAGAGLEP